MNESKVKSIIGQDVKLILTTVTIVVTVLGSFYTVKSEVSLLSQKVDSLLIQLNQQQTIIAQLASDNADNRTKIAVLESKQPK